MTLYDDTVRGLNECAPDIVRVISVPCITALPFHCSACGAKLDLSRPRAERCPKCAAARRSAK